MIPAYRRVTPDDQAKITIRSGLTADFYGRYVDSRVRGSWRWALVRRGEKLRVIGMESSNTFVFLEIECDSVGGHDDVTAAIDILI
jgi:hypothetical protein